ncbi:MAG: hypothetical protein M0C28_45750 [Candidatus Moduliflexus flocculans]|nr:hypothetical protein [Candidatus Moduliflexus flocculans]
MLQVRVVPDAKLPRGATGPGRDRRALGPFRPRVRPDDFIRRSQARPDAG